MTNEEIKKECKALYGQIASASERLKELRLICKHENTFKGNWSYRIGVIKPATICSDCGELIKYEKGAPVFTKTNQNENTN